MDIFVKDKKYKIMDLIKITLKTTPFLSSLIFLQKIIDGIFPSLLLLAIANVINSAMLIFNQKIGFNEINLDLIILTGIMVFQISFSIIMDIVHRKVKMKIDNFVEVENLIKQASLDFYYIENQECNAKINRVMNGYSNNIFNTYIDLLEVLEIIVRFLCLFLIFINYKVWWVATIVFISIVPIFYISYTSGLKIYKFYKKNYPVELEMYHSTYILKNREVSDERILFGFTEVINKKWFESQDILKKKQIKLNGKIDFHKKLPTILTWMLTFIMIFILANFTINKVITIGLFIALVNNLIDLNNYITGNFSRLAGNYARTKEYLKDLTEICNFNSNKNYLCVPSEEMLDIRKIEFKDVTFSYPDSNRVILNHISFIIEGGKNYAFVGRNGAGKSTIIKLITGLYDNYEGSILINDINLRDIDYSIRKSMMGVIYQDFAKYQISLIDNIDLGNTKFLRNKNNRDFNKRNRIINKIGLAELIEKLPDGLDTHIGKLYQNGQDISGGEWQRLALARLLMKDASLYILDEPTASLDPLSESNLYEMFSTVSENKTTILISHRLGSVKIVDYIFLLEEGVVCEEGNHNDLMIMNGLYANMYNLQKEWYYNENE